MALTEKIRRARAGSNDSSIKRAHPAAISASRTGSAKRCARAVGSMRPAVRTKSGSPITSELAAVQVSPTTQPARVSPTVPASAWLTAGCPTSSAAAARGERVMNSASNHRRQSFISCRMILVGRSATYTGSVEGWPLMMSSLKSLLETVKPLVTS